MKKITLAILISGLLASQLSFGAAKPVSSRFDPRNQAIAYNPYDTTVINSATGYISTLVFDDDEKVVETKVGWEQGWDISSTDNRVYIRLRPVSQNVEQVNSEGDTETKSVAFDPENNLDRWKTNLFIVTTKRNYSIELNAKSFNAPDKISFVVNYRYPDERRKENQKLEQQRLAELARKNEINAINKTLENAKSPRNWKYYARVAKGSEYITPDYVYDDGRFTYFGYNPMKKIPSLFVQFGEQETITNPTIEKHGNYTVLIAHSISDKWVIRLGNQVVGVENKGFGKIRLNDSDTVSDKVGIEVKQ
jgi:type IV secretion system protein VirB9